MEYLERAEGSLVGLAVGDALGANWEFWFPSAGLLDSQIVQNLLHSATVKIIEARIVFVSAKFRKD